MSERELRPIYGPWQIYTAEEEAKMMQDSLARQNKFCRDWETRKDASNGK